MQPPLPRRAERAAQPAKQKEDQAHPAEPPPTREPIQSQVKAVDATSQSQAVTAPDPHQANRESIAVRGMPPLDISRDWIDYTTTGVNGALVMVAAVQLVLLRRTLRATQCAALAAKQSADVARDALYPVQRAYLSATPAKPGAKFIHTIGEPPTIQYCLKITNRGSTPARVTSYRATVIASNMDHPGRPTEEHLHEVKVGHFLTGRDTFALWVASPIPCDLSEVYSGSRFLFVYGSIDYIDAFDRRYRIGFGRKYIQPHEAAVEFKPLRGRNLFQITEPGFNYDRERKEGEGDDWKDAPAPPPSTGLSGTTMP